jgi:hypothetical protein
LKYYGRTGRDKTEAAMTNHLTSERASGSSAHRAQNNGHFDVQELGQRGVNFLNRRSGSHFDLEHGKMGYKGMAIKVFILQE